MENKVDIGLLHQVVESDILRVMTSEIDSVKCVDILFVNRDVLAGCYRVEVHFNDGGRIKNVLGIVMECSKKYKFDWSRNRKYPKCHEFIISFRRG